MDAAWDLAGRNPGRGQVHFAAAVLSSRLGGGVMACRSYREAERWLAAAPPLPHDPDAHVLYLKHTRSIRSNQDRAEAHEQVVAAVEAWQDDFQYHCMEFVPEAGENGVYKMRPAVIEEESFVVRALYAQNSPVARLQDFETTLAGQDALNAERFIGMMKSVTPADRDPAEVHATLLEPQLQYEMRDGATMASWLVQHILYQHSAMGGATL